MASKPHRVVALCLGRRRRLRPRRPRRGLLARLDERRAAVRVRRLRARGRAGVATTTGFSIAGVAGPRGARRRPTRSIVPGYRDVVDPPPEAALEALRTRRRPRRAGGLDLHRRLRARPRRACSTAAARRPTGSGRTSWRSSFPRSRSIPTRSTSTTGEVLTSAGLSRRDRPLPAPGPPRPRRADRRQRRARDGRLAAPRRRPGAVHRAPAAGCATVPARSSRSARWALDHLTEPLDVAALAGRAGVSPRTFARRFLAETGTTPLKWLHAQRVLEARRLLEHTDLPVEQVASRAGFGSAPSLREHFRRATSDDADGLPAHVLVRSARPRRRGLSAQRVKATPPGSQPERSTTPSRPVTVPIRCAAG